MTKFFSPFYNQIGSTLHGLMSPYRSKSIEEICQYTQLFPLIFSFLYTKLSENYKSRFLHKVFKLNANNIFFASFFITSTFSHIRKIFSVKKSPANKNFEATRFFSFTSILCVIKTSTEKFIYRFDDHTRIAGYYQL